jgi:hypothetical protein
MTLTCKCVDPEDVVRFLPIPLEDETVLLVDANGAFAFQLALKPLESVARRHAKVALICGGINDVQLSCQSRLDCVGYALVDSAIDEEILEPGITKAADHFAFFAITLNRHAV